MTEGETPTSSSLRTSRLSQIGPEDLVKARESLRRSVRRPSENDLTNNKSRFQRRELSITHQGWLTKHSRGGLPNWNRRWFILIGGSLYYSRSATPTSTDLHIFCELLNMERVELVPSTATLTHAFRTVSEDGHALLFSAASNEERLTWSSLLEQAIGMQPVPLTILLAEMRREQDSAGGAMRLQVVSSDLADVHSALAASKEREEHLQSSVARLENLVSCLQEALVDKDERLWALAARLEEPSAANPEAGGTATGVSIPFAKAGGMRRVAHSHNSLFSLWGKSDPEGEAPTEKSTAAPAVTSVAAPLWPAVPSSSLVNPVALDNIVPPRPDCDAATSATPTPTAMPSLALAADGTSGVSKEASTKTIVIGSLSPKPSPRHRLGSIRKKVSSISVLALLSPRFSPRRAGSEASLVPAEAASPRAQPLQASKSASTSAAPIADLTTISTGAGATDATARLAVAIATPPTPAPAAAGAVQAEKRARSRRWSEPSLATLAQLDASLAARAGGPRPGMEPSHGGSHSAHPGAHHSARPYGASVEPSSTFIAVIKQGMLTKLSKGGFTANWNRRAFALLGSSLYYAKVHARPRPGLVRSTRHPLPVTCPCALCSPPLGPRLRRTVRASRISRSSLPRSTSAKSSLGPSRSTAM